MFREYLILFLLGHIVGDYYLQPRKMAEEKEKKLKWVFIHGLVYFCTVMVISLPVISNEICILVLCVALLHLIIDVSKYFYIRKSSHHPSERTIFVVDQILHLLCIIGIAYWAVKNGILMTGTAIGNDFFTIAGISETTVGRWTLAVLIVHKPANLFIQKTINDYKPKEENNLFKKDNNVGRMVGTLERIIMLILISVNQYAAIGLVLTAKSIARYDRIAKEKEFAEYYLLGTLLSSLVAVVCAAILL